MNKQKLYKQLALLLSLVLIFIATVQSTLAFIVVKTDSLKNTFSPFQEVFGDLIISKSVDHPFGSSYAIPEHIGFDFQVNLGSFYAGTTVKTTAGDAVADETGTITVTAKPGAAVGIQGIDEGTKATITELQKENDGFEAKDGVVSKEATVSGENSTTVEFINIYTPAAVKPTLVSVTGQKILEGRDWQAGDTFAFLLEQADAAGNWTPLATKEITYNAANDAFNTFDFNEAIQSLTFTQIGTYDFRLSEVVGELEGVDYDRSINYFRIVVSDADMDGKLEIQTVTATQNATVTKGEVAEEYHVGVTFNNTFVPSDEPEPPVVEIPDPEDITLAITANKTVNNTGSKAIGPENFTFALENVDGGDNLKKMTNTDGLAVFNLTFTAEDVDKTFHYKLSEINDGRDGVVYSTAVYDVQIAIALGVDNKLVATVTCNGETVESCVAAFTNTYHGEIPEPTPTGDNTNTTLYILLIAISGTATLLLAVSRRRQRS